MLELLNSELVLKNNIVPNCEFHKLHSQLTYETLKICLKLLTMIYGNSNFKVVKQSTTFIFVNFGFGVLILTLGLLS